MKKWLFYADEFLRRANWRDLALLKLCLCSAGVMWGMALPKRAHKAAAFTAVAVFVATYIPLMLRFFRVVRAVEGGGRAAGSAVPRG